jgi:hypothetical protein
MRSLFDAGGEAEHAPSHLNQGQEDHCVDEADWRFWSDATRLKATDHAASCLPQAQQDY